MSDIHLVRDYPYAPIQVWQAVTDPELVPLWTATGRGGRPVGFRPEPGTKFRFVGKPTPGWNGIVDCEVLDIDAPKLFRYTGVGGFLLSALLRRVRRRMLSTGLPAVLADLDDRGHLRPDSALRPKPLSRNG
jgi:hypothetical protein